MKHPWPLFQLTQPRRSQAAEARDDMKFLSLLASVGHAIKLGAVAAVKFEIKALPIEHEVAEAVSIVAPATGNVLEELLAVVGGVEQVATALNAASGTGAKKLTAALPAVEQLILSNPLFKGRKIADLDKYNNALEDFASACVDLFNAFEGSVPAPVPPAPKAPAVAPTA